MSRAAEKEDNVSAPEPDQSLERDEECPFCVIPLKRVLAENAYAYVVRDLYPLADGHTLVIPFEHEWDFFALSRECQEAMLDLARAAAEDLAGRGVHEHTLGVNNGPHAGQTVPHCHLHIIPRHDGDVPDPRGGVRWVLPERAAYWEFGEEV